MRQSLTLMAVVAVFTSCGLPPRHDGSGPWRFYSGIIFAHATESSASLNATKPSYYDFSNIATVTWRIGKDAPLPRTWEVDANCRVTEGTWRDTEFAPPSHGKTTLTGATDKPRVYGDGRIASGLDLPDVQNPGSAYTLVAEGENLPGYSLSATLGDEMTLTSPAIATSNREQIHVSRTEAFTVTWEPRSSGEVFLGLFQYTPDANKDYFHTVLCHWPASAGTATIPAEALGTLVPNKETAFTWLGFGSLAHPTQDSERVDVEGLIFHGRGVRVFVD